MNSKKQFLHIAIAFDQNYRFQAFALLTSILKNNPENKLYFHAIATGVSFDEKKDLKKYIESNGAKLSFYEVKEELIKKFVVMDKWTPAVYYRLFLPFLISENIDRLLYLDSDTIVINDLLELFTLELDYYPLAAVPDNYVKIQPLLGINEEGEYFNSGVMLMDTKRWREQMISERAIDYVLKHSERIRFVDQCALNAVLIKNWKKIDPKYNLLYSYVPEPISKKNLKAFLNNKVIVHFTLQRPWNMLCKNRLRFLYYYYLAQSPVGKTESIYNNFEWRGIPQWIKIRLLEFYHDQPLLQWFWRRSKLLRR